METDRGYPPHTAPGHPLGISNGYGYNLTPTGELVSLGVYCGFCKDIFRPDRGWIDRYFASSAGVSDEATAIKPLMLDFADRTAQKESDGDN